MITCNGKKGMRSKAEVRLSVDTFMGYVVLHVWEGREITHTFSPDRTFLEAMQNYAGLDLRMRKDEKVSPGAK